MCLLFIMDTALTPSIGNYGGADLKQRKHGH